METSAGVNKLARVIFQKMRETNQNTDQLELGRILSDMSLKTDHFPIPIPQGQYMIAMSLTYNDPLTITTDGLHSIKLPQKMYPLEPGDRVLVAWINQGKDVVVIEKIIG